MKSRRRRHRRPHHQGLGGVLGREAAVIRRRGVRSELVGGVEGSGATSAAAASVAAAPIAAARIAAAAVSAVQPYMCTGAPLGYTPYLTGG
eukprot:scaffold6677_cov49-Phaeocystis_antarctica.AAC.2